MKRGQIIFLALAALLSASANAVELRVATFNIRIGLEAPGTSSYESAKAVLERINSDVVVFQEVLLDDRVGSPSFLDTLTTDLAYPHVFVPQRGTDPSGRVVVMSRYPFLSTESINSPGNANDMTRAASAVVVDAPGTDNDPLIIGVHLKCCLDFEDPFRRAVEMRRVRDHLANSGFEALDNIILLGDFNLVGSSTSFDSQPSGLPFSFRLGSDITFPLAYSPNPLSYLSDLGILNSNPRQQNGSSRWTHSSRTILDYILVSEGLNSNGFEAEVYNSTLEANFAGLPKAGSPLASGVSRDASDHLAIFGDFELDGGPEISLALSNDTLTEGGEAATLTLALPAPAAQSVTITISKNDSGEIALSEESVTIPAGETSVTLTITPLQDSILDGLQTVRLFAGAENFSGNTLDLTVADIDSTSYRLTSASVPVTEDFANFEGLQNPAGWVVNSTDWRGQENGELAIRGPRSYGEGSLGILSGAELTLEANFQNDTGATIENLEIAYDAQQWRAAGNGSEDRIIASLIIDGVERAIPRLTFLAETNLPSGPLTTPLSDRKTALLTGLSIPTGSEFQLRFQAIPGMVGSAGSADVFINEFHYNNSGFDRDEFVEVVIGPAFAEDLSTVELVLYNGNTGNPYDNARSLDTFMPGSTDPEGYRFRYLEVSLQNGSPGGDALALAINGELSQFISYEGSFTPTSGIAAGVTSTDVGVAQNPAPPAGQGSISLTGTGTDAADFSWIRPEGPFTPGQPNQGQEFLSPAQPQGMAIDQLSVVVPIAVPELPQLAITTEGTTQVRLSIPTITGQRYQLQSSANLTNWTNEESRNGDGFLWSPTFDRANTKFYRVEVSFLP